MSAPKPPICSTLQQKSSPEETEFYLSNIARHFHLERNAFLNLQDELKASHGDRFVAISEGKIIDEDSDELKLAKRVSCLEHDLFILIKRVPINS